MTDSIATQEQQVQEETEMKRLEITLADNLIITYSGIDGALEALGLLRAAEDAILRNVGTEETEAPDEI